MEDCEHLAKWFNDIELQRLWLPRRQESTQRSAETAQSIAEKHQAPSDFKPLHELIILADEKIIGQTTLYLNPPHRRSKGAKIAWPTIVIGNPTARRQGIGTIVGKHIIELSCEAGATHIEAGVFEFNQPIRSLLEKNGFKEIAKVEGFTWQNGRSWADIR